MYLGLGERHKYTQQATFTGVTNAQCPCVNCRQKEKKRQTGFPVWRFRG